MHTEKDAFYLTNPQKTRSHSRIPCIDDNFVLIAKRVESLLGII